MEIKITKMQGCGNDFVILDYEEFLKMDCKMDEVARKLCDRNFGIGADGLIIPNINVEDTDIVEEVLEDVADTEELRDDETQVDEIIEDGVETVMVVSEKVEETVKKRIPRAEVTMDDYQTLLGFAGIPFDFDILMVVFTFLIS